MGDAPSCVTASSFEDRVIIRGTMWKSNKSMKDTLSRDEILKYQIAIG